MLARLAEARVEDVRVVIAYAAGVVRAGLAAPDAAQARALASTALAVAAAWLLVALAVPRGRRVVVDVLETVLAVVLIAMLLAVVLLLPLGIFFLLLKGLAFLFDLLVSIPGLPELWTSLRAKVGL